MKKHDEMTLKIAEIVFEKGDQLIEQNKKKSAKIHPATCSVFKCVKNTRYNASIASLHIMDPTNRAMLRNFMWRIIDRWVFASHKNRKEKTKDKDVQQIIIERGNTQQFMNAPIETMAIHDAMVDITMSKLKII